MKNYYFGRYRFLLVFFCSLFSLFYLDTPLFAYDKNVLIAPTRVIFDGKTRSSVVKLINPNNKAKSYNISLEVMERDEYGKANFIKSPNEKERLAIDMIRFSPRRVTIGPKVWQTVRLMVRKPKDLPPGEYRTQLIATEIPDSNLPNESGGKKPEKISISINYVFAISIPIIVRHGDGDVTIVSNTPKLIKKFEKYFLETNLERTGLYSTFFDVDAFFTPSGKAQRVEIGSCKGLTIYSTNKNLFAQLPVKDKDLLMNGKIEIEIRDREKNDTPLIHSKSYEINGMEVVNN